MGFPRQEYCSGLPFPPPRNLPDTGIKRAFPVSPALQANFYLFIFHTEPPGKPHSFPTSKQLDPGRISMQISSLSGMCYYNQPI